MRENIEIGGNEYDFSAKELMQYNKYLLDVRRNGIATLYNINKKFITRELLITAVQYNGLIINDVLFFATYVSKIKDYKKLISELLMAAVGHTGFAINMILKNQYICANYAELMPKLFFAAVKQDGRAISSILKHLESFQNLKKFITSELLMASVEQNGALICLFLQNLEKSITPKLLIAAVEQYALAIRIIFNGKYSNIIENCKKLMPELISKLCFVAVKQNQDALEYCPDEVKYVMTIVAKIIHGEKLRKQENRIGISAVKELQACLALSGIFNKNDKSNNDKYYKKLEIVLDPLCYMMGNGGVSSYLFFNVIKAIEILRENGYKELLQKRNLFPKDNNYNTERNIERQQNEEREEQPLGKSIIQISIDPEISLHNNQYAINHSDKQPNNNCFIVSADNKESIGGGLGNNEILLPYNNQYVVNQYNNDKQSNDRFIIPVVKREKKCCCVLI